MVYGGGRVHRLRTRSKYYRGLNMYTGVGHSESLLSASDVKYPLPPLFTIFLQPGRGGFKNQRLYK